MTTLLILLVLNSILGYIAGIAGLYFLKLTNSINKGNYADFKENPKGIKAICYLLWPGTIINMRDHNTMSFDIVRGRDGSKSELDDPLILNWHKELYLGSMIISGIAPKLFYNTAVYALHILIFIMKKIIVAIKSLFKAIKKIIYFLGKIFQPKCVK